MQSVSYDDSGPSQVEYTVIWKFVNVAKSKIDESAMIPGKTKRKILCNVNMDYY